MTANDPDTLAFYADEAVRYANQIQARSFEHLDTYLALLSPGATILELGCGGGDDTAHMLERGFNVAPTDGSPEIAAEAQKRLGIPVSVLQFQDITAENAYDGVWASACLLHVPRTALPDIISHIHRALRPDGQFFASFKSGTAEGRDRFGRYFNYPSPDWLRDAYQADRWQTIDIQTVMGSGYDKEPTEWLHVSATKRG
ncbi:class I SAM-dependent methyltransferase [Phyllobacterium sp. TAF24]|uniref:class I SAM-dependent methyltransferase n=1 Tax=Phyllobacterium sp. TAF24 TaxID=3233068 RepID=UPI003F964BC6